jgi:hypothetical protein
MTCRAMKAAILREKVANLMEGLNQTTEFGYNTGYWGFETSCRRKIVRAQKKLAAALAALSDSERAQLTWPGFGKVKRRGVKDNVDTDAGP